MQGEESLTVSDVSLDKKNGLGERRIQTGETGRIGTAPLHHLKMTGSNRMI